MMPVSGVEVAHITNLKTEIESITETVEEF
jgi:hypothetical protein